MSANTTLGLRPAVADAVTCASLKTYGESLRSIVLTGSLARDEGTFVHCAGHLRILGDAEVFLVFNDGTPLPSDDQIQSLCHEAEAVLQLAGIGCTLDLCPVHGNYFHGLRPAIFSFELRTCGRVLWGEDVLRLAPDFSSSEIPLEEGFRILANRIIEVLGALGGNGVDIPYATTKLFLDMATSLLLFTGCFEAGYGKRQVRLAALAQERRPGLPFPLAEFSEIVSRCTDWKARGAAMPWVSDECWREARAYAEKLWHWELTALDRSERMGNRLRGWMYVMRAEGWWRSFRRWPRWFWMGLWGSPRWWIYSAGSQVFFELPQLLETTQWPVAALKRFASKLPATTDRRPQAVARPARQLCLDVYMNYREFLAGTLA